MIIKNFHNGFTLIEMLLVVGILSVVTLIGGDILITVFKSYNKANILSEIRKNGDFVLAVVSDELKHSFSFDQADCSLTSPKSCLKYRSIRDSKTKFIDLDSDALNCNNGFVRYYDDYAGNPLSFSSLTNSKKDGVSIDELSFTISTSFGGSVTYITISFNAKEPCGGVVGASFTNTIEVRGY